METTNIDIWKRAFPNARLEDIAQCSAMVIKHYGQSNRHYHNFDHVTALIRQIIRASLIRSDENILINVALFHDVIYIPGRKDNEHKSAELAKKWLAILQVDTHTAQRTCAIIKATASHKSDDFLTQLFLDMDLSILGANELNYQEYTSQIRKEHYQVPHCLYKIGRKRFLAQMLSRTTIFSTPKYYKSFEKMARKNMKNELNSLKLW